MFEIDHHKQAMSERRRAFIVGHPVSHSRSPLIHGYWLREHGIEGSYERIDVTPDDFDSFFDSLHQSDFVGGNVTVPHKESAFCKVNTLTSRAKLIGAVNTLVVMRDGTVLGDNTDAPGFTENLDQALGSGWSAAYSSVLVLGAGGAARAVVTGLVQGGVEHVIVVNRTRARADALMTISPRHITTIAWQELSGALVNVDLLINTTSMGMSLQEPLIVDLDRLPRHAAVADIVYSPLETPLLAEARRRGLKTIDGLGMLLHQAAPGFFYWFGVQPKITAELRSLVEMDILT